MTIEENGEEYKVLKGSEVKTLREEILEEQDFICPLCKKKIEIQNAALDHKHKRKNDPLIQDKNGLIRGVLHKTCNSVEGKIINSIKRYLGNYSENEVIEFLENLIQYYKKDPYNYIHPSEYSEPKISKRQYNKLKKEYENREKFENSGRKKKFPEFPKSGKITKELKRISEEFGISLYL